MTDVSNRDLWILVIGAVIAIFGRWGVEQMSLTRASDDGKFETLRQDIVLLDARSSAADNALQSALDVVRTEQQQRGFLVQEAKSKSEENERNIVRLTDTLDKMDNKLDQVLTSVLEGK